jgi:hypothetical protein
MNMIAMLGAVETTTGLDADLERTLDVIGVFAFALSGGLLAVRKSYELVGVVALATVTALGGGVTRDIILGATPPVASVRIWLRMAQLNPHRRSGTPSRRPIWATRRTGSPAHCDGPGTRGIASPAECRGGRSGPCNRPAAESPTTAS